MLKSEKSFPKREPFHVPQRVPGDLDQIAAIYDAIHTEEESGRATIGWIRAIYPTRQTAADAIQAGDMGGLRAGLIAAKIDRAQWTSMPTPLEPGRRPGRRSRPPHPGGGPQLQGLRRRCHFEDLGRKQNCTALRMDTNERNAATPPLAGLGATRGGHRVLRLQRHPRRPAGLPGKIIVSYPTETSQKNRPPNAWFGGLVLLSGFHYP